MAKADIGRHSGTSSADGRSDEFLVLMMTEPVRRDLAEEFAGCQVPRNG